MDAIGSPRHDRPFRIGDYVVDPTRNRVAGPAGETALQPKVIDVLCALAERPGEVLSRSDLIDCVWSKEFGADESLTRAISQLRKTFGDTRDVPQVIETISKRGYRLMIPPKELVDQTSFSARSRSTRRIVVAALIIIALAAGALLLALKPQPAEAPPVRSDRTGIIVTVEPFTSDDRGLPISGLEDELSTEMARSPLIRARTGTAPEKSGSGTLQYRMRSAIQRLGDKLRIAVRLDNAASGEVVWGETFDRSYDPQFSERASVISQVARDSFLPCWAPQSSRSHASRRRRSCRGKRR